MLLVFVKRSVYIYFGDVLVKSSHWHSHDNKFEIVSCYGTTLLYVLPHQRVNFGIALHLCSIIFLQRDLKWHDLGII